MLTLITGTPGSGKSMRAVSKILDAIKDGTRAVYSDVADLDIAGVLAAPDDWRDTPHGSIVVYDEAQKKFPAYPGSGVSKDERIRALETHRHSGHDLIFITQDPALIDQHLRKLVGRHEHIHRADGLQTVRIYAWDRAVTSPMSVSERKSADEEVFSLKGPARGLYKSATLHTHKFKIPRKAVFLAAVISIAGGLFLYGLFGRQHAFSAIRGPLADGVQASEKAVGASAGAATRGLVPRPGEEWKIASTLPALSGCAVLSTSCRAWDVSGAQLDLSQAECLNLCLNPLPLDFKAERARTLAVVADVQDKEPVTPALSFSNQAFGGVGVMGDHFTGIDAASRGTISPPSSPGLASGKPPP